jgi:DNA-binding transcriptional regulator GbsR (MarR family)
MARTAAPASNLPETETRLVISTGRPADQVAFDTAVVGFFVEAAGLLGVPRSVAAIYGMVFASPVPLSFADIEARLDISKGSISQGLRILREIGAVTEVSAATSRVELFTPDLELRKLIARFISFRLQTQLTSGQKRLAAIANQVPKANLPHRELLRERIKHLTGWHKKAHALLPVARTFLKLGS